MGNFAPNREELAWAAGFWDGEGCTTPQRHKTGAVSLHLTVHQVFRPNLERFYAAIGGLGKLYGPEIRNTGKPISSWATGKFEHGQAVIAMLWPFLSQDKKDQYKRVLAEIKAVPNWHLTYEQKQSIRATAYHARRRAALKVNSSKAQVN